MIRIKLARQWAALLAGLLALPSAISSAGFSADNWDRVVSAGSTAATSKLKNGFAIMVLKFCHSGWIA